MFDNSPEAYFHLYLLQLFLLRHSTLSSDTHIFCRYNVAIIKDVERIIDML